MTWRKFFFTFPCTQFLKKIHRKWTSETVNVIAKTNIQHFSMLYTLIDHKTDVKPLDRFVNILTSILWERPWKIDVEWLIGHIVNKLDYR